jgi:DNA-binding MarR family transcriptional regulator
MSKQKESPLNLIPLPKPLKKTIKISHDDGIYYEEYTLETTYRTKWRAKGGFAMLSKEAMQHLTKLKLSGTDYSVLMLLLGSVDYDNLTNISQREVQERLGVAQANVSKSFKRLRERAIIAEVPTDKRIKVYQINLQLCVAGAQGVKPSNNGDEFTDGAVKNFSQKSFFCNPAYD